MNLVEKYCKIIKIDSEDLLNLPKQSEHDFHHYNQKIYDVLKDQIKELQFIIKYLDGDDIEQTKGLLENIEGYLYNAAEMCNNELHNSISYLYQWGDYWKDLAENTLDENNITDHCNSKYSNDLEKIRLAEKINNYLK